MDEQEITVYRGYPLSIVPKVVSISDNKSKSNIKYSWETTDSNIAEIIKGKLVGNNIGDAVLTCRLNEDDQVYSLLFVHVCEPVITLSSADESIELACNTDDYQYTIQLLMEPEQAHCDEIVYSSNNEKVATVDSLGRVTAVAPGNAKITVVTKMNGVKNSPKCIVNVTVKKRIVSIEDENLLVEIPIKKTAKLSPTIVPSDASNKKIKWVSSDESVAKVDANGIVTGLTTGTSRIVAEAQDGSGVILNYIVNIIRPVAKVHNSREGKMSYAAAVNEKIYINKLFWVEPEQASKRTLDLEVYKDNKKLDILFNYKFENNDSISQRNITFFKPGLYSIKATSTDGTNKSAKAKVRIYPEDLMALELYYARWDSYSNDYLGISFQIINKDYGLGVDAVELYVYATDAWGNKIYGTTVYKGTTEKYIGPGKSLYSERIYIPNRSKISKIYCGIHKIKFNEIRKTKEYTVDYYNWSYK